MAKILVGLSGGVDSSVAAALLVEQGHEVVGAYMKNWVNTDSIPGECPWERDIDDALAVSKKLGIEFRVIDLVDAYKTRIVNYLIEGYRSGFTPNPDVLCNREMKFGVFLDYALEQGFEYVATGHYVRKRTRSNGTADILRGADPNKDQTYFLALINQWQAQHALFPVGEIMKPQVRDIAHRFDLPTADKKDSQGICFIGKVKMSDFIRHYIPDKPGDIIDTNGKKMGTHPGLHLFTIGQRKGHGIASPKEGIAYVVVGKDIKNNRLIVGYEDLHTPGLYTTQAIVGSLSQIDPDFQFTGLVEAQPRYRALADPAHAERIDDTHVKLTFIHPQRAIAVGQVCGFYEGGRLLGGGFFESLQ